MSEVIEKPRLVNVNQSYWNIIQCLFAAGEAAPGNPKKSDEFTTFFTENPHYRFGNPDTMVTHKAIRDSSIEFSSKVKGLRHIIKTVWQTEEDAIIIEMDVAYYRFDGKTVTLPVMDFFRFEGDKISELRIFMDVNPVFA